MVKSRPQRDKSFRFDPLKAQQSELLRDDLPSSLQSSDDCVRELACIAVANLSDHTNPEELSKLVIERITDAHPAVQIAALHASITLSQKHSDVLIALGIVQLVLPVISTHIGKDQFYSDKQEDVISHSLLSTSLYLLSTIASENETVFLTLKQSCLVDQCISGVLCGNKQVALASIDLLLLFSESDKIFSQVLLSRQSRAFLEVLPRLDSETKISLVNLVVTALEEIGNYADIFRHALPIVIELLNLDIHSEFLLNVNDKLSDLDYRAQELFWTTEARAQQSALEILTNLLASEDGADPPVLSYLNMDNIKFVAKAANGVPKEVVLNLFSYPDLVVTMLNLQNAGFSCLQNLILNSNTLQGFVGEIWSMLLEHFERSLEFSEEETEFQEEFIEQLAIVSKNMCAICKKYGELITDKKQHIGSFFFGVDKGNCEVTVNLLGVLSCFAKEELQPDEVNQIVSLLIKCCKDEEIEINAEALNVFFDVFNDERFDDVLRTAGVMELLAGGVEAFKMKIMNCCDYEVREHAQEAFENLVEFIKYKAGHMA